MQRERERVSLSSSTSECSIKDEGGALAKREIGNKRIDMFVYVCLCVGVEEERELRSQKHEQNNEKHLQSGMNSSYTSYICRRWGLA